MQLVLCFFKYTILIGLYTAHSHLTAQLLFHGITLIASTTVRPTGAERFDDTILYFRDRLSRSVD